MRASRKGVKFIAGWEGFRSCPYRDAVGVWTIGYGETLNVGPATRCISETEARRKLRRRINRDFAPAVRRLISRRLNQRQFDALVSFTYNVGEGALASSTLRKRLNAGQPKAQVFREELPRWTNGGLAGLVKRRAAEVAIATRGDYSGRP